MIGTDFYLEINSKQDFKHILKYAPLLGYYVEDEYEYKGNKLFACFWDDMSFDISPKPPEDYWEFDKITYEQFQKIIVDIDYIQLPIKSVDISKVSVYNILGYYLGTDLIITFDKNTFTALLTSAGSVRIKKPVAEFWGRSYTKEQAFIAIEDHFKNEYY